VPTKHVVAMEAYAKALRMMPMHIADNAGACVHIAMAVNMYAYITSYIYIHICVIYVYIYIFLYICMHIYIYRVNPIHISG